MCRFGDRQAIEFLVTSMKETRRSKMAVESLGQIGDRSDFPMFIDVLFFFFQAEDGIRDGTVTGVQTCALPISMRVWDIRQTIQMVRQLTASNAVVRLQADGSMAVNALYASLFTTGCELHLWN